MLQFLKLNKFLLFNDQAISFEGNFTVITGETGSGKSMFIKALRFVLGDKQELPAMDLSVTAEFKLEQNNSILKTLLSENDIDVEEDLLILRRNLTSDNKSKIFINDVSVTIKLLKKISDELVEFHSQHKQLDAFSKSNSLAIIDQFVNDNILQEKVALLYQQINKLSNEIIEYQHEIQSLKQDKDHIEHSLQELQQLDPKIGEESELIEKKRLFNDKVKIVTAIEALLNLFSRDEGIINQLLRAQRSLAKFENNIDLDDSIENALHYLNELQSQAEHKLREFDDYDNIEDIEARLSKIKEFSRKYRCTSDQLVDVTQNYQEKSHKLETMTNYLEQKNREKDILLKEYFSYAENLSQKRIIAAKLLEQKILDELKQLKLEQIELQIEITPNQLRPISANGIDQSKFLIKTNKGFDFAEINEIASGGELSRIMLAFKVALAQSNQKNTIIFDEIDSGTGGAVAETIGNRMKKLAQTNQIIAISHQPQVSAKADQHLLVDKSTGAIAKTIISNLNTEQRTQEIARMLAGINVSKAAVQAALSLLKK